MCADTRLSDLRDAGDAIETLIEHRAYLPPGGMLVMLAGRLRDDIREKLGMRPLGRAERGPEVKPLKDLSDTDLKRLDKAVGALVGRFTRLMDDPELIALLTAVHAQLGVESYARARLAGARTS